MKKSFSRFLALLPLFALFLSIAVSAEEVRYKKDTVFGKVEVAAKDAKGQVSEVRIKDKDGQTFSFRECKVVNANDPNPKKKAIYKITQNDLNQLARFETRLVRIHVTHTSGNVVDMGPAVLMDSPDKKI